MRNKRLWKSLRKIASFLKSVWEWEPVFLGALKCGLGFLHARLAHSSQGFTPRAVLWEATFRTRGLLTLRSALIYLNFDFPMIKKLRNLSRLKNLNQQSIFSIGNDALL